MTSWLRRYGYLLIPLAFLFAAYGRVFQVWFRSDDFAWLGLKLSIDSPTRLWQALFVPQAQGTIRLLSERIPYLTFTSLFGYETAPFRILALLTQAGSTILLALILFRLTGSRLAGSLAPVLWLLNSGLAVALCWFAAFNQILCAFFLLGAFYAFLERRRVLTWTLFLLGFGALEINLVFPAILIWYCLLLDRARLRECLPFCVPSLLFAALHLFVIPKAPDPSYQMHFDAALPQTLWRYFLWTLGPQRWADVWEISRRWTAWGTPALLTGMAAFLLWEWRQRERAGLFLLGCFVIVIAPVVPLKSHISDYYLAAASFGVAAFGAVAVARCWRAHWLAGAMALGLLGIYVWPGYQLRRLTLGWYLRETREAELLVRHIVEARRVHPGKAIVVSNIPRMLYYNGFYDSPFRLYGVKDVWLTPGENPELAGDPEALRFTYPAANILWAAERRAVVAYLWEQPGLRAITQPIVEKLSRGTVPPLPQWADLGQPLFAELLDEGWTERVVSNNTRPMTGRGTFRLGGYVPAGSRLHLLAFAPAVLFAAGPVELKARFNGVDAAPVPLTVAGAPFDLDIPIPPEAGAAPVLQVELICNRTIKNQAGRDVSIVFGVVDIR